MNWEQIAGIMRIIIAGGVTMAAKHGLIPGIDPDAATADLTSVAVICAMSLWHWWRHAVIPAIVVLLSLNFDPASAADLGVAVAPKIPAQCSTTNCTGPYAYIGVGGQGTNADILGSGLSGSVFSNGAEFSIGGGYEYWSGQYFLAIEAGGGYTIPAAGQAVAIGDRFNLEIPIKAGIGLSNLFGAPTNPTTFDQLAANVISPYGIVGPRFRGSATGVEAGAGLQYTLGNHWAVSVEYTHTNFDKTQGDLIVNTDNLVRLRFERHNLF